ncbi:hypothetical protein SDRG_11398 [Saprolegnia diclina VS20]|uniref:Ricin B lectin domain-containing protein n=1 Tax=Saprolegnia diclina (strain VS20) TaxID=1156394 RepID=T0PZC1_SAPDV|nr:hypothetical protein SDRG_11398 [Saprolegnia diclina VS20]EQC30919.1 hypothetical protein SDRG_11398 [Saprolegnia diclina VS20]|eukprot:XP_008615657.1 hypothetical protein SDRG_11398 [Saprolegnia diclina VS20]
MKLVLSSLLLAVASAVPLQLCTVDGMFLSEYEKSLYADVRRNNKNEHFDYDPTTKLLKATSNGQCVCAESGKLVTEKCDPNDASQHWEVDLNHVFAPGAYSCLQTSTPGVPVGLAKCVWETSITAGQFLTDCSTGVPEYVTITSVSKNRLLEFQTGLYARPSEDIANQVFAWDKANKMLKSASNGQCLDAFKDANGKVQVHTYACDVKNSNQKWNFNPSTKTLEHATHAGQCLDVDHSDFHVQMWACVPGNTNQMWTITSYNAEARRKW